METAAQSGDPEIAEELLRFYVEQKERECFAAALFTCYDLIRPDVALEVSRSCHHLAFLQLISQCRPSITLVVSVLSRCNRCQIKMCTTCCAQLQVATVGHSCIVTMCSRRIL